MELRDITKSFPGVVANERVNLTLRRGEIHALIGENGAGKSTLMRILYGLYPPDEGRIIVQGEETSISSPRAALARGIGMVHQHFVLVDRFTVTENVILGAEGGPLVNREAARSRVRELAAASGFEVDPDARVEDLSVGEEQRVEILKALYRGIDLLILDEPTAVLTPNEARELFRNLRELRDAGTTIVFISHKLDEVLDIADRITVLRRGKVVGETTPDQTSKSELAEMMVGRPVLFRVDKPKVEDRPPVLVVEDLEVSGHLIEINLRIRGGEVLGVAGVEGNGQRELAETIIGFRGVSSGRIVLDDNDITRWSTARRRAEGVAFVPEDRHDRGLVLEMSLWENSLLGRQDKGAFAGRFGILNKHKARDAAAQLMRDFDVRASDVAAPAATLSGGNQQKLILARELEGQPRLLVAHQPTRGLDVGAIEFVWKRFLEQKSQGAAILLISAELDEIYELSDRIVTLFEGRITGEFTPDAAPEQLGMGMTGRAGAG